MSNKIVLLVVIGLSILLVSVTVWGIAWPEWLTRTYGPELREAIQRYEEVLGSVEGVRDPAIMAQVTTGDYLDFLIRVRCVDCGSVEVATATHVEVLKVLEYSSNISKVSVRVEWGLHQVDPNTGAVLSPCIAQAFLESYILKRESGIWKVAGVEGSYRHSIVNTPELRAKYCKD